MSFHPMTHAKFVFVRRDAHHAPLQKPYEGSFKVVKAGEKTFEVERGNPMETISIYRLKPAHVDINQPTQVALPRPEAAHEKNWLLRHPFLALLVLAGALWRSARGLTPNQQCPESSSLMLA